MVKSIGLRAMSAATNAASFTAAVFTASFSTAAQQSSLNLNVWRKVYWT
jgi:hypothetical protein